MQKSQFVQKGATSFSLDVPARRQTYCFLLLPKATMLAVNSAIEVLRIANQITGQELYNWHIASVDGAPVTGSNLIRVAADLAMDNIPDTAQTFLCSGVEPESNLDSRAVSWVRRRWAHGHPVGGMCTGAFILAKAGSLKGRRFTLHWENQPAFREIFPDLEPTETQVERDNGLNTCGGGIAALDLMLSVVADDYGNDLAEIIADMCLHHRSANVQAPQRTSMSVAIGSRNRKLVQVLELMKANIEQPLALEQIAASCDLSRRQMERLFSVHVEMSPYRYYLSLRLDHAYSLLTGTSLSVVEISLASGFQDTNTFTKNFRQRYGHAPKDFRRQWQS